MPKYYDGLFAQGPTTTGTLAVRTGAVTGKFLKCADNSTGVAEWAELPPIAYVSYVAKNGSDVSGTGALHNPYATIQKALDQITLAGSVPTSTEARRVHVVSVAPGTYDESIAIDIGGKHVIVRATGDVNLGTFNNSGWMPSGTARNVTVTCSKNNVDSIDWSFALVGGTADQNNRIRVSGTLTMSNSTVGDTAAHLAMQGVSLFGWDGALVGNSSSVVATGWAGNLQCYWSQVRCYGQITGVCRLQKAEACRFDKLVSVATYSQVMDSQFVAGMTWTTAPNEVPPIGVKGCSLTGTFTGSTGVDLLLDSVSYQSFAANACSLGTNTRLVLIDGPTPVARVATASNAYVVSSSSIASVYYVTPTATATFTLPALSEVTYGRTITVVNLSSTFTVAVTAAGTDRIWDASTTSVTLSGQYSSMSLVGGDSTTKIWYAI
jgi:hypothetical protein